MTPKPLWTYLGRFVLPLLLFGAAIGAWFLANELGTTERASASTETTDAAATSMTSVRRLPEFAAASRADNALEDALASLPADPGGLSCAAVLVDGEPVVSSRTDQALRAPYAQLLITSHAALEILGSNYRYETVVLANDLPNEDGRITGGVFVVGGGDPYLMSRSYWRTLDRRPTKRTFIEDLAQAVSAAGVVRIEGGVIGVERRYDDARTLPGWPDEYITQGLLGPLTALQIDDAYVGWPADNLGNATPAEDPPFFAVEEFIGHLADAGVEANGFHRTVFPDEQLPSLVPVARISSAPLIETVEQMMTLNDATAAELIVKELGVADGRDGSTQAGGQVIQRVLQARGLDVPVAFRDGSGLDPVGGTTCDQLAGLIDGLDADHLTLQALPAYDAPGAFSGLLRGIELSSDLRVVGGRHGDASALVARTVDQGRTVTVVSIINRVGGTTGTDRAYQRALVELVDDLRFSTTVEAIAVDE